MDKIAWNEMNNNIWRVNTEKYHKEYWYTHA